MLLDQLAELLGRRDIRLQPSDRPARTRRHHRAKTHRGYSLRQLDISAYRWTTPHGLGRLVTPTGTREFEPLGAIGELYRT